MSIEKNILTEENESMPNHNVSMTVFWMSMVFLVVYILNELDIFKVNKNIMRYSALIIVIITVIVMVMGNYKKLSQKPATKYAMMISILIEVFFIMMILEQWVCFALLLPLAMATHYQDRKVIWTALVGCVLISLISVPAGAILGFWDNEYNVMLIQATGYDVTGIQPMANYSALEYIQKMVLYIGLPRVLICVGFSSIVFYLRVTRVRNVEARVTAQLREEESQKMLAFMERDELTGLYTRQAFYQKAEKLLQENKNTRYDLIISDIEDFRNINKNYGEETGDLILKKIGETLQRGEDHGVLCARYGGDQFVSMVPHVPGISEENLVSIYDEIRKKGPEVSVDGKFGIYDDVDHDLPVSVLCDRALLALKTVKQRYGKLFAKYCTELQEEYDRITYIRHNMEKDLREGKFKVVYQPKVDVRTEKPAGCEALIRWELTENNWISPDDFIPAFESNGFIEETDAYVWKKACEYQKDLKNKGIHPVPISVNASKLIIEQEGFIDRILSDVRENEITPNLLQLEVTESQFLGNSKIMIDNLNKCRDAGIGIALDDFGKGYSSMSILTEIPISTVKIDKALLDQIQDEKKIKVLEACIKLAKMLDLKVVAEGVETREQLEVLKNMGADLIQGYYYSKPLSKEDFELYLKNNN